MIRHGRSVVDREGVGQLHALSWHTARRVRPWAEPGHPAPINEPSGEPRPGGDPALWDTEQARAYATGRAVPEIDAVNHPDDLLDAREVAALHDLTASQFHRIHNDNRISVTVPKPDAVYFGVAHWRRATAEAMQLHVTSDEPRPYGSRTEQRATLAAVASALAQPGKQINISELARRAGVSRMTARAFLREHSGEHPSQP